MPESAITYDTSKGPQREANADAISIRRTLENEGSIAAVGKLRSEIDSVPERDRAAYNAALLKNLQGDGRSSNILPELSIAFGVENSSAILRDSKKPWVSEKIVDPDKIRSAASRETNPVYQELYREMGAKYQALQAENKWNPYVWQDNSQITQFFSPNVFARQLHEQLQRDGIRAENRKSLGLLATHPRLFNDIANGGDITMDKVREFQDRWNQPGANGADFRKRYGSTQEEQNRVGETMERLRTAFDEDRNKDNKPDSVLEDNVAGRIPRYTGIEWFHSYGKMTWESLLNGLGYKSMEEARKRVPSDAGGKQAVDGKQSAEGKRASDSSSSSKLIETTAIDNSSTKVILGQGPYAVAKKMLEGSDFDASTLRDLTKVLQKELGINWKSIRVGTPIINPNGKDNLELVRSKIQATNNTKLIEWFNRKFPNR